MAKKTGLNEEALAILKRNENNVASAAPEFSKLLAEREDYRLAIATAYLKNIAPREPISRRREGPHRRPKAKMPTASQKRNNLIAEKQYAHALFARKLRGGKTLGNVRIHELRDIAQQSAMAAAKFIARGLEDAIDLFAMAHIVDHCVAADPFALVSETIGTDTLEQIYNEARFEANEATLQGAEHFRATLIAAATKHSRLNLQAPTEANP